MNTKKLLSIAIIAALPFGAMAANISGDMYTAPTAADTNHPAPTTNANAPYGRANIDTDDQEHIATTAYVKGAYNSAIAAVNKVNSDKQNKLVNNSNQPFADTIIVLNGETGDDIARQMINAEATYNMLDDNGLNTSLLSAAGVVGAISGMLSTQVVPIYTTWENDSATTGVNLTHINNVE